MIHTSSALTNWLIIAVLSTNIIGLRVGWLWNDINLFYIVAMPLIAWAGVRVAAKGRLRLNGYSLLVAVLAGYFFLIAVVRGIDPRTSLVFAALFFFVSTVWFSTYQLIVQVDFDHVITWSNTFASIYVIVSMVYSVAMGLPRLDGIWGGAATFLGIVCISYLTFSVYLFARKRITVITFMFFLTVYLLGVVYSGSRASIALLIIPAGYYIISPGWVSKRALFFACLSGGIGAVSLFYVVSYGVYDFSYVAERFTLIFSDSDDAVSRLEHYKLVLLLLDGPWDLVFGIGLEPYDAVEGQITAFLGQFNVVHSAYGQILLGGGVVALSLAIAIWIVLCRDARRYLCPQRLHLFWAFFVLTFSMAFVYPDFLSRFIWVYLPLCIYAPVRDRYA